MYHVWTKNDIDILKECYPRMPSKEVSLLLGVSAKAVRSKASSLSVVASHRNWSFPHPVKAIVPSPELSYLIGAFKGDGSIYRYASIYGLSFGVKDLEFIQAVQNTIRKVVSKVPKIYKVRNHESMLYKFLMSNKDLFTVLSQPLIDLKRIIDIYPIDFLRGFFDAEGTAVATIGHKKSWSWTQYRVSFYNTKKELLDIVRELLIRLGITPSPNYYVTIGNMGKTQQPCYVLSICKKKAIARFMQLIVSSIPRKRLLVNV
jgi:hypothetical protein